MGKNVELIELVLESTGAGNELISDMFIEAFKNYEILQTDEKSDDEDNYDEKLQSSCEILQSLLLKYDKTVLLCKPTAVIDFIEVLLVKKATCVDEGTLRILIAALSIIISSLSDV